MQDALYVLHEFIAGRLCNSGGTGTPGIVQVPTMTGAYKKSFTRKSFAAFFGPAPNTVDPSSDILN